MDRSVLARKPMTELKDIAAHLDMRGYQKLRKAELIDAIVASATGQAAEQAAPEGGDTLFDQGETPSSARKVLPPGARNGSSNGSGGAPASDDDAADDGDASADARADDGDVDDDEQDGSSSREGSDDGARGRERGRSRDEDDDDGDDDPSAESDDDDGDDGDGSRRRSRRDRRKRNRDRGDDSGGQGRDSGGDGASMKDQDSGNDRDGGKDQSSAKKQDRGGTDRSGGSNDKRGAKDKKGGGNSGKDNEPGEVRAGVLDILPEGYGFLRTTGYLPGDRDVYVSQGQIRKHALRRGDVVQGPIRQQRSNEKVPALHHVQRVNGAELVSGKVADRVDFRSLTAIHADELLEFAGPEAPAVLRAMDVLAPVGRGHRGLIISPYAGGRTELIKALANGLAQHSPDVHLMIVLVDERPEDVTDVERSVPGETISSTFDHPVDEHAQVAELALERARRLVELGHDVVILLDSLTRLARAHGGGAAPGAVQAAKRFFGTARNVDDGGSLTILATLQTDTGSEIDDIVARELQSTANVIVTLDGDVPRSERPAVRPDQTQTLREERLLDDEDLEGRRSRRTELIGDATGADATAAVIRALS